MTNEKSLINALAALRVQVAPLDIRLADPLCRLAAHYSQQRQLNRATPLVEEQLRVYRQHRGETDLKTVESLTWLASLYSALGRSDSAEEVLTDFATRFGADAAVPPERRAAVLNQLVEHRYQRLRYDEGLVLCRQVLRLLAPVRTTTVAARTQYHRAHNNLGALLVAVGDSAQALRVFRSNLRANARTLPAGHPSLVAQMLNLAALSRLRGGIVESERLTIRAIRQCQQVSGWSHPLVAQGLSNLGAYRLQGGRPASAEGLLRKALRIRRKLHPRGHLQICRALRQLAEAQLAVGRTSDAERLLESARGLLEQHHPTEELQRAQVLCSLGFVFLGAGRLANSERTLVQSLQIQERLLGPQNSQLIQTLNGLGCLNAARGNLVAAEHYHGRALDLAEQHLGEDHPELAKTLIWSGEVALASGRIVPAQKAFERALTLRETALGPQHPLVAEVLTRCGQLALAEGLPARALSIGARARLIYQQSRECPPLAMADVLAIAAEASRRLHRYRGADTISMEELQLREKVVGAQHVSLLPALRRLGLICIERELPLEAERHLRRGLAIAEKSLGALHEGGIPFTEQLGRLLLLKRDFAEADRWVERTIKLCQRCYGEQAEQVSVALLSFSDCLRKADRLKEAADFEQRAIDLRNRNCHVLL